MFDKMVEITKQTLIEQVLNAQLKERWEMERKLQKLAKTMDYLERAKREEETHLIKQPIKSTWWMMKYFLNNNRLA